MYKSNKVDVKVVNQSVTTVTGQALENYRYQQMEISMLKIEIAPGGQTGWHLHPAHANLSAFIESGTLTICYASGEEMTFTAGTALVEAVDAIHNGENRGDVPVVLNVVVVHEKGLPFVVPMAA
jgi:quercetin dioxygenase-like cupin family protein